MPKKKVAVALSDWLLDELDDAAGHALTSRSALVEQAVTDYLVRHRTREDDAAFRTKATAALEDMESYAAEYEADPATAMEPTSLEKLRALRAEGRGVGA